MGKRLTQEEFIEKAQCVHGNKYTYEHTVYKNSRSKIIVTCPLHNDFSIKVNNFLQGHGCPICGFNKKYTQENFIECLRKKHGDIYDYTKVKFTNLDNNVIIGCPKHGFFEKKAENALYGTHLCLKCFNELQSKRYTKDETVFLEQIKSIHNNKYDYSKVRYINALTPITIICPKHGEFQQMPKNHLQGQGCKKCRDESISLTTEQFIEKAKKVHGNKFDYSKVNYKNNHTKVCIIYPATKEESWQLPSNHLKGESPVFITAPKPKSKSSLNINEFICRAKTIHGDKYDYSNVEYLNSYTKVKIICPKHGEFYQTPKMHWKGQGCPQCGIEKNSINRCLTTEEFIKKALLVHGNKYDYSKVDYVTAHRNICIICPEHGEFHQTPNKHLQGQGCSKCINFVSQWEKEISDFISDLGINIITSDRSHLKNNREIDIFLPDYNIGIECDGIKWHNELYKDKQYHLQKTQECIEQGIKLIHIFEDEWLYKQDIVKSVILDNLGIYENEIYVKDCQIKNISNLESNNFFNKNHIQGYCSAKITYGLFYNNELVAAMSFNKIRKTKNWILCRYCCKLNTNVIGGALKLFKCFQDRQNFDIIKAYCDLRWFDGLLYNKLGFHYDYTSQPNYFYVNEHKRENRFKYKKSILIKDDYDSFKSIHDIMFSRKLYRIYDCGNKVYYFKK